MTEKFDQDKNHTIDANEMGSMLKELGIHLNEQQISELFAAYDMDGNKSFTFDELILFVSC